MKRCLQRVGLFTENLRVEFIQRLQDEVDETSVLLRVRLLAGKFTGFLIEVNIAP